MRPTREIRPRAILSSGLGSSADPPSADEVSFNSTGLSYTDADDVQEALVDLDTALSNPVHTVTASGSAVEIDYEVARVWDITLTDDCVLTIVNPPPPATRGVLEIILRQGTGAPYTVTWPAEVFWQDTADGGSDGTAPVLWTDEDAQDDIELATVDGGVSWGGNHLEAGGSSSLTVKDEGTPLATAAESLDFVGSGVTASGTGAAKTITISGEPTGAAGGGLSGTYPNPSVTDDSHSHTAATLPSSSGGGHVHVTEEIHLSDGSTTTFTLDAYYEPGSVQAWNSTTIARLLVTEVLPDQVTVSAAGTTGDQLIFDYAATLV